MPDAAAPAAPAGGARAPAAPQSFVADLRRIVPLAWPVFVGQIAVLAFSTADTLLIARHGTLDLAALAIGSAAYISVFVGLMGVVLAVGPLTGQSFGAGRHGEAGGQLQQALWLAFALSALGCTVLAFPQPFLALAHAPPEVAAKVRAYTGALAFALPPALFFTAFRGFNTAVSRPKAVMALQLGGLAVKVPLSALLIHGAALPASAGALAGLGFGPLGVGGCGIATACVMWGQWLAAWALLRRDPFYARFGWQHRGLIARPRRAALAGLLRLGVPMGLSIMVEVTGFTFMAFFIARFGSVAVAGHQIAANLAAMLFMVPMGLANATSVLAAQRIGAADLGAARRLGVHGMQIACALAAALGTALLLLRGPVVGLYTRDAAVAAAALPLVAIVAVFHVFDAAQAMAGFVLRAWRIATRPLVVYAASVWGVGLGGGCALAFDLGGHVPAALHGAPGFWVAGTAGLMVAAAGLAGLLWWRTRGVTDGAARGGG